MRAYKNLKLWTLGLVGCLGLCVSSARADLEVGATANVRATADFEEPLTKLGTWFDEAKRGRSWRPNGVAQEWRPYCNGRWDWTDVGWYWVSTEPWAWACYHYGNWDFEPASGWFWTPGVEWGPAWVTWRAGGGHIGWAPLARRTEATQASSSQLQATSEFIFVEERRFCDPLQLSTVILNNPTLLSQTKVIGGVKREQRDIPNVGQRTIISNEGPQIAAVEKATGRTIRAKPIQEVVRLTPVPRQFDPGDGSPPRELHDARTAPGAPSPFTNRQPTITPTPPRDAGSPRPSGDESPPPAPPPTPLPEQPSAPPTPVVPPTPPASPVKPAPRSSGAGHALQPISAPAQELDQRDSS